MRDGFGAYISKERVLETLDAILSSKEINSSLIQDLPWGCTLEGRFFWNNYYGRLWRKELMEPYDATDITKPQKRTLLRLERIRSSILLGLEDNL